MVNRFILNEVSYFGPGARKELPTVIASRGWKKALVVTDKGLMKFGVAKMVLDVLDGADIAYEVFDDVKPNPTVSNVTAGIEACKKAEADFIIAIGGGSSMDTAKGIGVVVTNPEFADIVSLGGCTYQEQVLAYRCSSYYSWYRSRDHHQLCDYRRAASAEDGMRRS